MRELFSQKVQGIALSRLVIQRAEQHHIGMQIGSFTAALLAGFSSLAFGRLVTEELLITRADSLVPYAL